MTDSKPALFADAKTRRRRPPRTSQAVPQLDDALEQAMIAILESRPASGETLEVAFRSKEHHLGALFAALGAKESRLLHRRLSEAAAGDRVAELFQGLVVDRRARLLAFLGDARRREAIAQVRR